MAEVKHEATHWRKTTIDLPGAGNSAGIAAMPNGHVLVSKGNCVYDVDPVTVNVVPFAGSSQNAAGSGDGPRLLATFNEPRGLLVDSLGVFVVCFRGHTIRLVANDLVSTYAGSSVSPGFRDGPRATALFRQPNEMAHCARKYLVTDYGNNRVRIIDAETGIVTSIGNGNPNSRDGAFANCSLHGPFGISLSLMSPHDTVYVSEWNGSCLRRIDLASGTTPILAGRGEGDVIGPLGLAQFNHCGGVVSLDNGDIVLADITNLKVKLITTTGMVQTITTSNNPTALCVSSDGSLFWTEWNGSLHRIEHFTQPSLDSRWASINCNALLEHLHFGSDVQLHHTPSDTTFHLHSSVLKLLGISSDRLKLLADAPHPKASLESFFLFLYGSLPSPFDSPSTRAHIASMLRSIGKDQWASVLEHLFVKSISSLPPETLIDLAVDLHTSFGVEHPCIDMICAQLRNSRNKFNKAKVAILNALQAFPLLSASLLVDVGGNHELYRPPNVALFQQTSHPLAVGVRQLGRGLRWRPKDKPGDLETQFGLEPNFAFAIRGSTSDTLLHIHDWVVFSRWSYFRRMMESGMQESQSRLAELPAELSPELVLAIVQSAYGSAIDFTTLSDDDCLFAVEHGIELGLVNAERDPMIEFEALVEFARSRVFPPLTLDNCILLLNRLNQYGSKSAQTHALEFIARSINQIARTPENDSILDDLPSHVTPQLLRLMMKQVHK